VDPAGDRGPHAEPAATAAHPPAATPTSTGCEAFGSCGTPAATGQAGASATQTPAPAEQAPVDVAQAAPARTGVIFDWPETDPSAPRNCKAGRYVGEFACRLFIVATTGDGAFDVSGTIDMTLEQTPDGELLRIADGKFASAALAAIPMSADIVGELDCSASRFEGRLENGIFSVALGLPIPFTQGIFSGPLSSDYDQASATLSGTWNMMGNLDGFPGTCMNGSWSATWMP
jgi:hypothetical protein